MAQFPLCWMASHCRDCVSTGTHFTLHCSLGSSCAMHSCERLRCSGKPGISNWLVEDDGEDDAADDDELLDSPAAADVSSGAIPAAKRISCGGFTPRAMPESSRTSTACFTQTRPMFLNPCPTSRAQGWMDSRPPELPDGHREISFARG